MNLYKGTAACEEEFRHCNRTRATLEMRLNARDAIMKDLVDGLNRQQPSQVRQSIKWIGEQIQQIKDASSANRQFALKQFHSVRLKHFPPKRY